jgi:hypothetical protein
LLPLLVFAPFAWGCAATVPAVQVDGLPLKRVVIYRNGVGYFERVGHVEAEKVTFRVRQSEVGDFLATMAVLEKGGSSVRSASFPMKIDGDDDDEPTSSDPQGAYLKPNSAEKKPKKDPNGLVTVSLELDGKQHDLQVGYVAETPVWRPSYRLVIQPNGVADLQAWGIVQNLSGEDWKGVTLSLIAGAPLAFQATLGEPVIPMRPTVTDSGEVIGAMPTSETSLAQAPPPPPPPPPLAPPPATAPSPEPMEHAKKDSKIGGKRKQEAAASRAAGPGRPSKRPSGGGAKGDYDQPKAAAEEVSMDAPSGYAAPASPPARREAFNGPRNLSALAAVAVEGSSTRYDIPTAVTVPDKSATMVMLLSSRVSGESVFLFAPAPGVPDSTSHPFRVARFTNASAGLLERGPIAVFEGGAFLGEGMVDPLPPGATTTVPFALERGVAVEMNYKTGEEGARVAHIEAGELRIDRDYRFETRYKLKNGTDTAAKMLIKHSRRSGTRLYQPPAGTEDNTGTGSALIPGDIGARGAGEIVVDERQTTTRTVDWLSPLADEAVSAYIADSRADAQVAGELKKAWTIRPVYLRAIEEQTKLEIEEQELSRATNETRENIKAIEKNTAAAELRKQLTERLAKASKRLDEIGKRKVELRLSIDEQRVRFNDVVRGIKLTKALPPPT